MPGSRRPGDRGASRVAPPGSSIGVAGRVVPEFRQHPGAEDQAESGKTTQDLGVWVIFKTLGELSLQLPDLVREAIDHEASEPTTCP